MEEEFKSELGSAFADRFESEMMVKSNEEARAEFDSRGPLVDLQKAVLALNDRIDNLSSGSGETITKSAGVNRTLVEVPSSNDLADMSWDEVHRLAASSLRGGE
jgi:hypothetical protein